MKTVVFYSYKGGTGRTLALANIARFAGGIGKRVIVIDLDLEAPGLTYKLLRDAQRAPPPQAGRAHSAADRVPAPLAPAQDPAGRDAP